MLKDWQIRLAQLEDARFFFNLRNDPTTRLMSRNSQKINWAEHKHWFSKKIEDSRCELFVVALNNINIGTMRVDHHDQNSELSWMIAPDQRGLGLGKVMLKQFVGFRPGNYLAVVRTNNTASRKMCESAGFNQRGTELDYIHYVNYDVSSVTQS